VGTQGGGAIILNSSLQMKNTCWINNTATVGGALAFYEGVGYMSGVNIFLNNSATDSGGAIWIYNSSTVSLDGEEEFSGNSIGGNPTSPDANVYADEVSGGTLWYPVNGTVPPYTEGFYTEFPVTYVDASTNCTAVGGCNGTASRPFNNIFDALDYGYTEFGGQIYLMPGTYTGSGNTNLDLYPGNDYFISAWPGMAGDVVIDCQGNGFAMNTQNGNFVLTNVTIQNCASTYQDGGGAIYANNASMVLTNVNFISNSANYGGAMSIIESTVVINGGGFYNNTATSDGGAIDVVQSGIRLAGDVIFSGNKIAGAGVNDLSCQQAVIQNDGTVSFTFDSPSCEVSLSSTSTLAVFPGSLNGILFPRKGSSGSIQANVFAELAFDSVVELNASAGMIPIESTRLTKQNLSWTLSLVNDTESFNLKYSAFGPLLQYVQIDHAFFVQDSLYTPLGATSPLSIGEGTIKTSISIAFWPFLSPSNRLAVTLTANASQPVTQFIPITQSLNNGSLGFLIQTDDLTVSFNSVDYAVYDDVANVGGVSITPTTLSTGVSFQFDFKSFTTWMAFDPQFGVVLGGTANGDGSTNVGLIVGLTIGLTGGAIILTIAFAVAFTVVVYVVRTRRRVELENRLAEVNSSL